MGIHGYRPDAEFMSGAKDTNGNLATVGDEKFADGFGHGVTILEKLPQLMDTRGPGGIVRIVLQVGRTNVAAGHTKGDLVK
jgi:hypothetical protein